MQAPSEQRSEQAPKEVRLHFGPFVVLETQRRLERAGNLVRLGPRSFDLLVQLVQRAGEFVSKEELLSAVWRNVVVEEGSVRVHMSTLRKALGDPEAAEAFREWITTVPLRGYRFNGRVRREVVDTEIAGQRPARGFTKPPVRLTGLVGRDHDVENVRAALDVHRLVTIAGSGGIGKTSVAIRAAERARLTNEAEVAFVDLSPLTSQDHVLGTMATALGATADLPDTVEVIERCLAGRNVVLMVDNCEHVLDSLAPPINRLLTALPGLRILATSREPLRLDGEIVLRLSPLAVPDTEQVTLAQALQWPAVRLLVDRAHAAGAGNFRESQAPLLAQIARRLDGIPLAIELVAARFGAQSIGDLALRLDDHMRLRSTGSRGALPRHKTLAAALEWSVALLYEDELRLFRRLSVFRGRFDAESALSVAVGDMDAEVAFDVLISLANKSLVFFDNDDAIAPYRLLDTTRSFAAELLSHSNERPVMLQRHAGFMLDLMRAATTDVPNLPGKVWGERYAFRLDDVRFALDACLTEPMDTKTAAALISASGPLWVHVSQVVEYRDRVIEALALVDKLPEPDIEMATSLNIALMTALLHTGGSNDVLNAVCDRALAGALEVNVPALELRARWGRCTHDMFRGEYTAALKHSDALLAFAGSRAYPLAKILSHRVSAMANHFCGRFDVSRQHSVAALTIPSGSGRAQANIVGPDTVVATKALLCRTLWLQGETKSALQTAVDAVALAESSGHNVSLCAALYGACPVALWAQDRELASKWVPMMLEEARRRGLSGWLRYAEWFFEGLQLLASPDREQHVHAVSARLPAYDAPRKEMLVTFSVDWLDDDLLDRVSSGEGQWAAAEVLRAAGWRSEQGGMADEAESFYLRSIDVARQQGASAWELRTALSLAGMWAGRDQGRQAVRLLDQVIERAPRDGENVDLARAGELRVALACS